MVSASGLWALAVALACAAACHSSECDKLRAAALSTTFGVKLHCSASTCRASLTPGDARRLASGLAPGNVAACADLPASDSKLSSAAFSDPCCSAGGSACTHFYMYVVSESAHTLCIALR